MAVLTLICHGQLWFNQQRRTVPKPSIRLLGRWVIPVIAVFLSSWAISSCADHELAPGFKLLCAAGLLLVLLGVRLFEGKKDSLLALNFGYARRSPIAWMKVQRLAGSCWLTAGLLMIIFLQLLGGLPLYAGGIILLLLIIPPVFCAVRH